MNASLATPNVLKFFKDYKRFIHISYHTLDYIQKKKTKLPIKQVYMLPILLCQYHACWCPGDASHVLTK